MLLTYLLVTHIKFIVNLLITMTKFFCFYWLFFVHHSLSFGLESDSGQELKLIMFDDQSSDPLALCNDGTRGGYYFGEAADPTQKNVFVIHLPGGGQCYDKSSCDSRADDMMSSKYFQSSITVEGILDKSPEHTPLWGANKVYLGYCSSDGYMGDAGASDETWGYHFRGQRLVHSMFQALLDRHNFLNATTVYFSGSSAGARGMMVHADQLVRSYVPAGAEVIAYLDSPYYLDLPSYSPNFEGFPYEEQQKFLYFNTTAILSEECVNSFPADEGWKCQFGEYRMPFVKVPYFLVASQYDAYQLGTSTELDPSQYNATAYQYANEFSVDDRRKLLTLVDHVIKQNERAKNTNNIGFGFYAWACYNHAVASSSLFYTAATNEGVTQKDAFEAYLLAYGVNQQMSANTSTIVWMDTCLTFACGEHCEG